MELIFIITRQEKHIFVNLENCKQIMQPLEDTATEKVKKVLKNLKFQNLRKKRNLKFQNLRKNLNNYILVF